MAKVVSAVLRWKNGDRQFVEIDGDIPTWREIIWQVNDLDGGDHKVGETVIFRLYTLNGMVPLGRRAYVEWP
jgi:hypothetical protein